MYQVWFDSSSRFPLRVRTHTDRHTKVTEATDQSPSHACRRGVGNETNVHLFRVISRGRLKLKHIFESNLSSYFYNSHYKRAGSTTFTLKRFGATKDQGSLKGACHLKNFIGHMFKYAAFDLKPIYNH